jgi:hypothetical protein
VLFGNPETTTGGRALKFYSSVRLDVRRGDVIKSGDEILGNEVKIKVVKNKVAPPFKAAVVEITYGKGINKEAELLELAVKFDVIHKSGAWFEYNGEKIEFEYCYTLKESNWDYILYVSEIGVYEVLYKVGKYKNEIDNTRFHLITIRVIIEVIA